MLVKEKEITVDEFEQFLRLPEYQGRLFELVNGEIVEKMPTEEHGTIVLNIGAAIKAHIRKQGRGRVAAEVRYRTLSDQYNSRQPDLSYSHGLRPAVTEGAVPTMPNLVVEVQSPDDSIKAMRERAEYFIAHDVELVWLVFPRKRYVEIYSPDQEIEILFGSDHLTGGEALPGFSMPIEEVFADL